MISIERVQELRDRYDELLRLEVSEFGVKPTEVRHLVGRLAEFECALIVGGTLAHRSNQHGFDVVAPDDRKISVKATAQKTGFVAISRNTLRFADDLMIFQYTNSKLSMIHYGCIQRAVSAARLYAPSNNFELDISKAKALQSAAVAQG